jgi:hypothetical protein
MLNICKINRIIFRKVFNSNIKISDKFNIKYALKCFYKRKGIIKSISDNEAIIIFMLQVSWDIYRKQSNDYSQMCKREAEVLTYAENFENLEKPCSSDSLAMGGGGGL